jgi:Zn-dependent metalloprotease
MKSSLRRLVNTLVSLIVTLTMLVPGFQPKPVSAQEPAGGLLRSYNAESGKVNWISGADHQPLAVLGPRATGMTAEAQSLALVERFAPEFGLTRPAEELRLSEIDQPSAERVVSKYQQMYQGVPVMAGELIVNASKAGALLSMNGEVSPGLTLDINPKLTIETAIEIAKQGMVKWYGGDAKDYAASVQSGLWIFDESLLKPSTRPATLVWRLEMTSTAQLAPIRELVLVDAKTGNVTLHFNQVDTAWGGSEMSKVTPSQGKQTKTASSKPTLNTEIPAVAGTTWYVSNAGNDTNDCLSPATPCATINGAIGKAASGDTILVAVGTYTGSGSEVVAITKSLSLIGGWGINFITQGGTSIIDGQGVRRGVGTIGSPVLVDHFTIQNGFSNNTGGGIYNNGTLSLSNSIVKGNVSNSMGGGIFNSLGTLTISNTTVSSNTGVGGGGIENFNGNLTINNSAISGNNIPDNYQGSGIETEGIAILNNSTVSNNRGGRGAGISTIAGTIILNNSTISDNQNRGLENAFGRGTMQNTIIARNGIGGDCYGGGITSQGYNLIRNSDGCAITATVGDLFGTSANPINPRLGPLQDNGGPTFTYALMSGSPAINAGSPSAPGSGGNACLPTDQRGVARPAGERCDIGAYEGFVPWTPSPRVITYTSYSNGLPGDFRCDETQPNCTSGSDPHADAAHKYAIGTYDFYAARYLRDSIDNNGMPIVSTAHYCSLYSCSYANAFWNGSQMVYGDAYGFPLADDVVAHELTHGVTDYESNLFYFYQSGAINESFSDLWGEYYDQTNGQGNDTPAVKWLMGEDVTGATPVRSMSNPPAYGDPDKMSSANYDKTDADNGGVHTNSGVNNKAVFLMVDGGSFNGKTVSALGWDKTAAIYYEAQTNLLSSGADYSDLYFALQQACVNMTGQLGITAADCAQVKNALDAVQMNTQPVAGFNPDAPLCAAGLYPNPLFKDNLESDSANWAMTGYWSRNSGYASSGTRMLYGDDYYISSESSAAMANGVALPVSNSMYLHFKHAFAFEYYLTEYYDGGVLEYTVNDGATWADASPLFVDGQNYKGIIMNYTGTTNTLKGRNGFVADSHGYVSSRYNLASLGGKTVKFRWRFATDNMYYYLGWMVDDVQIYTCKNTPPFPYVVSSVRVNADPTSLNSVNFNVTFSESVSGVDASDFTLSTSGVLGAAVSGVSGTGSSYTVTVNTGYGSGTIRLDVADNDSILSAFSVPLGGAGVGNGNFTTGEAYTISKAPLITAFSAPAYVNTLDIPITSFSAWDTDLAGYMITSSAAQPWASAVDWSVSPPATFTVLSAGTYTLYPWAKDIAGNVSYPYASPFSVVVDLTAPAAASITRLDPDPNGLSTVNFAVTFSEPVTGVDATDFSLTSSGVSGPAVSGVSGSGSAYTVSVSTGSGSGTIRLDLTDNNSIVDAASNPLGGAGAGDGNFTTGESYTITKTWIFGDVSNTYWSWSYIERLYNAGITSGCSAVPLNYCPDNTVTRAQMAIFLLKGIHGAGYVPPAVGGGSGFADVPADHWAARWIKQLAVEGITGGCGGGNYCPEGNVTRAQMAIFLLKARHGTAFAPPVATGLFTDVPVGYWADKWIEQLAVEGITAGCGGGNYCPDDNVTRAQMAIFLVRTFNLP